MSNENKARLAHKILDDLFKGKMVLDEEREFLRRALPELPAQKTLAEIIAHVDDAWIEASGNEWAGNSYDPDVSIEDWLGELHVHLKGLMDTPVAEPAKPTHPEFRETEVEYGNAPVGTVVARGNGLPWVKEKSNYWTRPDAAKSDYGMSLGSRRVLRWGWGK